MEKLKDLLESIGYKFKDLLENIMAMDYKRGIARLKEKFKKAKYLLKRIFSMDYKRMIEVAKKVSKKASKFWIFIMVDMILCGIKYGAGYLDYALFEMYNLNPEQRATYLTRGKNNDLVLKYNSKEHFDDFDNKVKFNRIFNKYLKREYLSLKDEDKNTVINWINDKKVFVAKVVDGTCGKGVIKVDLSEYKDANETYGFLIDNNYMLIEELIIQKGELNELHPKSINDVRIVTVLNDDKVHIIGAFLRIGNGEFVDNINSGGMFAPIDIEEGLIRYPAADKDGNVYKKHPLTNVRIVNFKIPLWQECLQLVDEAARIVPSVRYVGWDIAITNDGPVFIEANPFPGHDIYQIPVHTPNKIGVMPKFDEAEGIVYDDDEY